MTNIKYERVKQTVDHEPQNEEIELESETQMRNHTTSKGHPYVVTSRSAATGTMGTTKKKSFAYTIIVTLFLIMCYFTLSIGLTFYQRLLLQEFKFPLSVVVYHLCFKLVMSAVIRSIYRSITKKSRIMLDWRTSVRKILPTGLASGIDIGFSNWGLELVQISLYTMTKSTTIVFILIFAILLKLEKKSWSLGAIVVMISGGLFLFTYKSTHFDALGFSFLLFASLSSGIRWTFAQLIMQKSKLGLHNPIDMIFHMQPWMILAILPFTIGFEGQRIADGFDTLLQTDTVVILTMWRRITEGALIAFVMEVSEFMVLTNTSSLTLSVAGIFKEICQLVLAVELYGDQLSLVNVLGLILCLGGICCHVVHKFWTYTEDQQTVDGSTNYDDEEDDSGLVTKNGLAPKYNPSFDTTSARFKAGAQHRPLLENESHGAEGSDHLVINNRNYISDDSDHGDNEAQDVLFDILKRREQ
ncbi:solute carrier family 35 member C2 [Sabethes cyaneus]|uniref:solute carrier family 35 member C2 n=1 Tax=Sabethes cyaneus TaxID=53552 RepID=UPI00221E2ECC|nr:solute carrier family 35 member C2 [Sabethes cyaneus]XP_053684397.1 solute carrier family 35 member C2 [Sabethes cyaneus]XP_053684399.1 solute carrier family 35 member C2 [Sabethes cyaneus]